MYDTSGLTPGLGSMCMLKGDFLKKCETKKTICKLFVAFKRTVGIRDVRRTTQKKWKVVYPGKKQTKETRGTEFNRLTASLFLPTEAIAELSSNPKHDSQWANISTSFPFSDFLSFSPDKRWDKSLCKAWRPTQTHTQVAGCPEQS